MLNIPIAIGVGADKTDVPFLPGSTVNGVSPASFHESFHATARNLASVTGIFSYATKGDEKIFALQGLIPARDGTPLSQLATDGNPTTGTDDGKRQPTYSSREGDGNSFSAERSTGKSCRKPVNSRDLRETDNLSVVDLNPTDAKPVSFNRSIRGTSARRYLAAMVERAGGFDETKASQRESLVKKLKVNRRSTPESPSMKGAHSADEATQSGWAHTAQELSTITLQGPPLVDKESPEVATVTVLHSRGVIRTEKRTQMSRGVAPSKDRLTGTERVGLDENRQLHVATESQQGEEDTNLSSGVPRALLHQRTDGAPSDVGQASNLGASPLTDGAFGMLPKSSVDPHPVFRQNPHAATTSEYIGEANSAVAVTGFEHRALAATPRMLEISVAGGTHGWLKVRAEMARDGAIHASISSASMSGEEMLRRELPSLTTYLHDERVSIRSLVVHVNADTQDFRGTATDSHNGSGRHHQQADNKTSDDKQESAAYKGVTESGTRGDEIDGITTWLPPMAYAGNAGWISVRA